MVSSSQTNLNLLWAELVLDALAEGGVECVCIGPGSRSSPLVVAAARRDELRKVVHLDERALAFCALGYAKASGKPVACITTSGTAAVNLWPAVVEAAQSETPLLLLTADRPPEARGTGANQTINQAHLYGAYARAFVDLPCPDTGIPADWVRQTVASALRATCAPPAGPVQINCMFREPLHPVADGQDYTTYLEATAESDALPAGRALEAAPGNRDRETEPAGGEFMAAAEASRMLAKATCGLILAGTLKSTAEQQAVEELAGALNWPLLADVTSGLRLGKAAVQRIRFYDHICGAQTWYDGQAADTVLHVGGPLVSKRLLTCLERERPRCWISVRESRLPYDPIRAVTHTVAGPLPATCAALAKHAAAGDAAWLERWLRADQAVAGALSPLLDDAALTEPAVARLVARHATADTPILLAASLPVREMDMFADAEGPRLAVFSNRGASGIDGTLATAAGISLARNARVLAVVGDLAALHDLNALLLLRRPDVRVTLVLVNNDGGGIFHLLPIAATEPQFETYWGTPHGLTFAAAAEGFGLAYAAPDSVPAFTRALEESLHTDVSTVVEVRSDRRANAELHGRLQAAAASALQPAGS